jgi:hypothetical protein
VLHRLTQLRTAVAPLAAEDVAGEAFAVGAAAAGCVAALLGRRSRQTDGG